MRQVTVRATDLGRILAAVPLSPDSDCWGVVCLSRSLRFRSITVCKTRERALAEKRRLTRLHRKLTRARKEKKL